MTGINVCYYVPFSPSAAVPPLDFPQNQSHYVLVPVSGPDSTVTLGLGQLERVTLSSGFRSILILT